MEIGALPLAAHVYFTQFLDDAVPAERESGLRMGLELLKLCDEVYVYGDVISEGMAAEIALAEEMGLPIFYMEGMKGDEKMYMADRSAVVDLFEYDGICGGTEPFCGFGQQL